MNILITGAKGFVGRTLVENLKTIRDGKNRTRNLQIENIYEYESDMDYVTLCTAQKESVKIEPTTGAELNK